MTAEKDLPTQARISLNPIIIGAAIALAVISFFVFGVDQEHPEWGEFWRIRPLLITPLAGAVGGAIFSFLHYRSSYGGLNKTLAIMLGIVVYVIGLFLGVVLGLDGTMWD